MENYDEGLVRFTFSGFADDGERDPFGVWDVPLMEVSTDDVGELTWRVAVPGDMDGREVIQTRAGALKLGQSYLTRAERELQAFIVGETSIPDDPLADGAVAFGAGEPVVEDHFRLQKQALDDMLSGFAGLDESQLMGAVAFGAGDVFDKPRNREGFREAYRRWQVFVARVQQMVSQYARVETVIGGERIGLTRVGWTGDFETHWTPETSALSREMHRETVHLALASRTALLRVVSVITTGAAGLIVKAAALPPGGQVLLIPAVRRFVLDVMAVLRKMGS